MLVCLATIVKRLQQLRGNTGAILAAVLLLLFVTTLVLLVRVTTLSWRVERLTSGISAEVEAQHRLGTVLASNQRTVTAHLSEVRRLLNLSPGRYTFDGEDDAVTLRSAGESNQTQLFYAALDRIRIEQELRALAHTLDSLVPNELGPFAGQAALVVRAAGRLRWRLEDAAGVAHHELVATPNLLLFSSLRGGRQQIPVVDGQFAAALRQAGNHLERAQRELRAALDAHRASVAALHSALNAQETRALFSRLQLTAQTHADEPLRHVTRVVAGRSGQEAFRIELDGSAQHIRIDGVVLAEGEGLSEAIVARAQRSDPRVAAQLEVSAAMNSVRDLGTDRVFQERLAQAGLRLQLDPRETLDFFVFDLEHLSNQRRFGGFAVQKGVGRLYVLDADDVVISTLETAGADPLADLRRLQEDLSRSTPPSDRSLPTDFPIGFRPAADSAGTNLILVGTHEGKADSIILAHLSPNRTISLISIPRDIWWRDRKLADFAQIYGVERLMPEIATIIGRRIDGWVAVDMYAFIEVVDLLGGIELTLTEPLIDPTYRVRDGETWSTLAYPAGTHHLNGVEALRIARSRHTTTDFGRSERQQVILEALRSRLNQLHAGNLDRYYRLFETLNRYVTSSYSMWELAQFFLAYRSAPIVNRTGLTFDNVLYNTYSNIHIRGLSFEEVDEDFFLGGWILLPRGDDWGVVRWFVEQNLRRY